MDLVELRTLAGGDRIAVRRMSVEHHVEAGAGDDQVAVGSLAGVSATLSRWPNTGGTLNAITARLVVDGGSGHRQPHRPRRATLDDSGDTAANTGRQTGDQVTGLGLGVGVTYTAFESLAVDARLRQRHLHRRQHPRRHLAAHRRSTPAPATTPSSSGPSAAAPRSTSARGDDTVRVSSTDTGTGGTLDGILGYLVLDGGDGTDKAFVDDAGVASPTGSAGSPAAAPRRPRHRPGRHRAAPEPAAGRHRAERLRRPLHDHRRPASAPPRPLDFDATAAKVQAALEAIVGAGNVVVTKAGGRWVIALPRCAGRCRRLGRRRSPRSPRSASAALHGGRRSAWSPASPR